MLGTAVLWMVFWLLFAVSRIWWWLKRPRATEWRSGKTRATLESEFRPARNQRKPDWVRRAVIRLRAWSPNLGCRKIADAFNRQCEASRESVSKSYVAEVLRKHAHEVTWLRRTIKHRTPRDMPRNRVWALDLTTVAELSGRQRLVLGVIDHGTRACLRLTQLADKRSLTIQRELIAVFRRFGIPKTLRSDNESCFTSGLIRAVLSLLGVKPQRTDKHCPWQNGRIERLFGTFKALLAKVAIANQGDLTQKLIELRAWYNHARPHQHLINRTPAEAWDGQNRSTNEPWLMRVWDGELTGWYFPP